MTAETMVIKWRCECGKSLKSRLDQIGASFRCSKCGKRGHVPGPSDAAKVSARLENESTADPHSDPDMDVEVHLAPPPVAPLAPRRADEPAPAAADFHEAADDEPSSDRTFVASPSRAKPPLLVPGTFRSLKITDELLIAPPETFRLANIAYVRWSSSRRKSMGELLAGILLFLLAVGGVVGGLGLLSTLGGAGFSLLKLLGAAALTALGVGALALLVRVMRPKFSYGVWVGAGPSERLVFATTDPDEVQKVYQLISDALENYDRLNDSQPLGD